MSHKEKEKKTDRLFKSSALEKLTRVHPAFAISYILVLSAALYAINFFYGYVSSTGTIIGLFFAGYLSWTIAEYTLHRFFFHMKSENKILKKIAYTMHGIHHDHPNDYKRLFMPPVPATIFMGLFFSLFYLVIGKAVFTFLPGFLMGYLSYAYTHFKMHQIRAPKGLKWLWTHHIKHHYQSEDAAFGVSTPLWDFIFRTLPTKVKVKTKVEEEQKLEEKSEEIAKDS